MSAMMKLTTKFKEDAEGNRLEVLSLSNKSKKDVISVRVCYAKSCERFAISMRSDFAVTDAAEAIARHAELVKQAESEGWEVTSTGSTEQFLEMSKFAADRLKEAADRARQRVEGARQREADRLEMKQYVKCLRQDVCGTPGPESFSPSDDSIRRWLALLPWLPEECPPEGINFFVSEGDE